MKHACLHPSEHYGMAGFPVSESLKSELQNLRNSVNSYHGFHGGRAIGALLKGVKGKSKSWGQAHTSDVV